MRTVLLWIAAALSGCSSPTSTPDLSASDARLEGPVRDAARAERAGRDATVDARRDATPPACAPGAWCWANPLPTGNRLNAIHGPSVKELFAVGEGGTLLRFDGTSWSALDAGATAALHAVHAVPGKVVAVGAAGTIVEGDGAVFKASLVGKETLHGLCSAGSDEHFAVGDGNVVLRRVAGSWSTVPPPGTDKGRLNAVHCAGGVVWVGGENGRLYRLDPASSTWTSQVVGTSSTSHRAIWGSGSTLLLGGWNGSLHRSVDGGKSWTSCSLSNLWVPVSAIWGSGPSEVYLVAGDRLYKHDGLKVSELAVVSLTSELRALHGAGGALFLGGAGGALLRYQQGALQAMLPASTLTPRNLRAVHGRTATDVLAVGEGGTILHYNGSAWKKLAVPETGGVDLNGVYWAPGGPTFVVGAGGKILRHEAGTWTAEASPTTAALHAVWAADSKHAVAVGGDYGKPVLVHLEETSWSVKPVPTGVSSAFDSVWGSAPNNVYAVAYGKLVRYDGGSWSLVTSTVFQGEPVRRVWGRGPSEVFVAGDWGRVFRFDGSGWTAIDAGTDHPRAISGDAQSILVGLESGEIVRGSGAGWVREVTRCGNVLAGIWLGPGKSFAVGASGTILEGR
jgi:hypothetical protein